MAQEFADFAGLVIVVDDKFLRRRAADGALATLARVHRFVIGYGHAIFGFQIHIPDSFRVFGVALFAPLEFALLAQRFHTVAANLVLVKCR
jgi:hypothetical protein